MRTAADYRRGCARPAPPRRPCTCRGTSRTIEGQQQTYPLLNVSAWKSMGRPMNCGRPLGCWLICMPGILVLGSSRAYLVPGDAELFGNVPRCLCPGHNWRSLYNRSAVRLSAIRVAAGSSVSPTGSVRRTSGNPGLTPPPPMHPQPRSVAAKAPPPPCRRHATASVER